MEKNSSQDGLYLYSETIASPSQLRDFQLPFCLTNDYARENLIQTRLISEKEKRRVFLRDSQAKAEHE
jgi:hypothetical protein